MYRTFTFPDYLLKHFALKIFINREVKNIDVQTSLFQLLNEFNIYAEKGIAVAVNNEVIPRTDWQEFFVKENDRVTVITATQGG